jgi:plasmid stabilization system protein ParE
MAYRVDLTERAARDLTRLYQTINAADSTLARAWFNGLEKLILSLDEHPARGATVPEDDTPRQLLHGRKGHRDRIIDAIDEADGAVTVLQKRSSRKPQGSAILASDGSVRLQAPPSLPSAP